MKNLLLDNRALLHYFQIAKLLLNKEMDKNSIRRPLEGVRVLDCGIYHAGPGGPAILGDLGAEVIKIEQPRVGDPIREQKKIGGIFFEIPGNRSIFCEGANYN